MREVPQRLVWSPTHSPIPHQLTRTHTLHPHSIGRMRRSRCCLHVLLFLVLLSSTPRAAAFTMQQTQTKKTGGRHDHAPPPPPRQPHDDPEQPRSTHKRTVVRRHDLGRRDLVHNVGLLSLGVVLASRVDLAPLASKGAVASAAAPPPVPPPPPPPVPTPDIPVTADPSPLQEFISGLAGGAASRASKELLLHPIDTWKTRLQYAKGDVPPAELFKDLYDGVWPALLVGTPAGAAFFATKDVLKGLAKATWGNEYRELTTIGAVFLANLPYWAIRNPAEVLKTQQQTGQVDSTAQGVRDAVRAEGVGGLYRGYASNVAYAFPTDAIKFVVYEALQKSFSRKLNPLESSALGSVASSVAQLLSTPLDVVRTRIMTTTTTKTGEEEDDDDNEAPASVLATARAIAQEEGVGKLFSGLTPRLTRAFLSGAIQFGSYELTKGSFFGGGKK